MIRMLLAAAILAALGAAPAHATLQIAFTDGSTVVTCADGQACDLAGPAHNIIILNETVGAFRIIGTVAASVSGPGVDNLQFSTSLIENTGATTGTLTAVVGDTNFVGPVSAVEESASLTFNDAVGSGVSRLKFYGDDANGQPAGIGLATPGVLLFSTSGAPTSDPDSFSGTHLSPFAASGLFSMTEAADLALAPGASITGFNESMLATSAIPEPRTWAMMIIGFALMGWVGMRRGHSARPAV